MPDEEDPERLQKLPDHLRCYRARRDVADGQAPRSREAERENGHGDADGDGRGQRYAPVTAPSAPTPPLPRMVSTVVPMRASPTVASSTRLRPLA